MTSLLGISVRERICNLKQSTCVFLFVVKQSNKKKEKKGGCSMHAQLKQYHYGANFEGLFVLNKGLLTFQGSHSGDTRLKGEVR